MGAGNEQARQELGAYLRHRRSLVSPESVGLPAGTRRRTPGLRREELAMLAGVSVSWYTWIEQGRPVNASVDVLHALARVLRLDPTERDHLVTLAGHSLRRSPAPVGSDVPDWARHLLDSMDPSPAYLLGPSWEYLAWNRAQERLFPAIGELADDERNLVWAIFGVPSTRSLIVDWPTEARRVLSEFRADIAPFRNEPEVRRLVDRLRTASPEFDEWWDLHDVAPFDTRLRRFDHPVDGPLTFAYQVLIPAGRTDLRFVVQLPVPSDASGEAWETADTTKGYR